MNNNTSFSTYFLAIFFITTVVMMFANLIIGLIMLFILSVWMIVAGGKNINSSECCSICHRKLTVMNTGAGGRLKDGAQLCIRCYSLLSLDVAANCEKYTLAEVQADIEKQTLQAMNQKEQNKP